MSKGLIHYNDIENLTLSETLIKINESEKIKYGHLTVNELQIAPLPIVKIMKDWQKLTFGYGVYILFDKDIPVYIGKATSSFLHRFLSHCCFDGRKAYGFNELARKISENKLGDISAAFDKSLFESEVIPLINELSIVRINCLGSSIDDKKCSRLERIIMKGYEEKGVRLFNSVPKTLREFNSTKTLKQLIL
jgi:hypothetical protein